MPLQMHAQKPPAAAHHPSPAVPLVSSMEFPTAEPASPVGSVPVVSAPPSLDFDDEDDDLPRPGKVWDNSGPSLKELLAAQAAKEAPPQPSAPAPSGDAEPSNVEPVNTNDLATLWRTLLDMMTAHGPALHSLLANGNFAGVEDDQAVIRYSKKNETFRKMMERNGKKDLVREGFSKILGKPMGVRFEVDETLEDPTVPTTSAVQSPPSASRPAAPPPAASRAAPPPPPPEPTGPPAIRITPELIEQMKQDPLVGSLMDKLGATPVKID